MAYNESLADRMREKLVELKKLEEKKMMGGLCFLLNGKMCCGIVKDDLMVRVIESRFEEAMSHPHSREMDFTGRPLKGFVFVAADGLKKDKDLAYWLDMGVEFVQSLPKAMSAKKTKKSVLKPQKKLTSKKHETSKKK